MKILALFPGQGSQAVGMGKDLAAQFPRARELFEEADSAVGFPLSRICFEGPAERLTETAITQPAILTVSTICFELAMLGKLKDQEIIAGAGHSLGEYSALVAAGSLRFRDAVQLVHKRGRYMQEAVPLGEGQMVAVLGKEQLEIEAAIEKVTEGVAEIANINAPGQIVVAGDRAGIREFQALLPGAKCKELQVSAPFHCRLMKPAEERLKSDLKSISISPAKFPIYANFSALGVTTTNEILSNLEKQVSGQVRWLQSMQRIHTEKAPTHSVEFGSGSVLSGMLKRIVPTIERISMGSSADFS
jgi:[acyl-carrier-protein] S-malonyltransferase